MAIRKYGRTQVGRRQVTMSLPRRFLAIIGGMLIGLVLRVNANEDNDKQSGAKLKLTCTESQVGSFTTFHMAQVCITAQHSHLHLLEVDWGDNSFGSKIGIDAKEGDVICLPADGRPKAYIGSGVHKARVWINGVPVYSGTVTTDRQGCQVVDGLNADIFPSLFDDAANHAPTAKPTEGEGSNDMVMSDAICVLPGEPCFILGDKQVLSRPCCESDNACLPLPNGLGSRCITTVAPTQTPSTSPTETPTLTPTAMPSNTPSVATTATPSVEGSSTPSSSPTAVVSATPSVTISTIPSEDGSAMPSTSPTAVASSTPSVTGSATPSASPTSGPTASPSASPSASPTGRPSALPSASPSVEGSSTPSSTPTAAASSKPSVAISAAPSAEGSSTPSSTPTAAASSMPSVIGSTTPSVEGSSTPSSSPTAAASNAPSVTVSAAPSAEGSAIPSQSPSETISGEPTDYPSPYPTSQDSSRPSEMPSAHLSTLPSVLVGSMLIKTPTLDHYTRHDQPANSLADTPTGRPSSSPTGQHSSRPSEMPSAHLSTLPSVLVGSMLIKTPTLDHYTRHDQPANSLADTPTGRPSSSPTAKHSQEPSMSPSTLTKSPSEEPSIAHSDIPSVEHSEAPTIEPSTIPSSVPTSSPSAQPSLSPTTEHSQKPSSSPSQLPTVVATTTPSSPPSELPTANPTSTPTSMPTANPSASPSFNPTDNPTYSPDIISDSEGCKEVDLSVRCTAETSDGKVLDCQELQFATLEDDYLQVKWKYTVTNNCSKPRIVARQHLTACSLCIPPGLQCTKEAHLFKPATSEDRYFVLPANQSSSTEEEQILDLDKPNPCMHSRDIVLRVRGATPVSQGSFAKDIKYTFVSPGR